MVKFMPVNLPDEYVESEEYAQDLLLDFEERSLVALLGLDSGIKDSVLNILQIYEQSGIYGLGLSAITNLLRRDVMAAARSAIYTQHPLRIAVLQQMIKEQQTTMRLLSAWQFTQLGVMAEDELYTLSIPDTAWYDSDMELASAYSAFLTRLSHTITAGAITGATISALRADVTKLFNKDYGLSLQTNIAKTARQAAALARRVAFSSMFGRYQEHFDGYMWITMLDERVCPYCRPLHGQVFYASQGGERPPAHMGCRCTTMAVPTVVKHNPVWERFRDWLDRLGF